jgi:site-specific recombinase XerD
VLKRPYDLPSKLYPRKAFQLPNVMTTDEVWQLLSHTISIKQRAIVELFYSSVVRLEEGSRIKVSDIDSKNMRIMVQQGKGNKDRYTLLSATALLTLREYVRKHRLIGIPFATPPVAPVIYIRTLAMSQRLSKAAKKDGYFRDNPSEDVVAK